MEWGAGRIRPQDQRGRAMLWVLGLRPSVTTRLPGQGVPMSQETPVPGQLGRLGAALPCPGLMATLLPSGHRHREQGHQEHTAGALQPVLQAQAEGKHGQGAPWIPELTATSPESCFQPAHRARLQPSRRPRPVSVAICLSVSEHAGRESISSRPLAPLSLFEQMSLGGIWGPAEDPPMRVNVRGARRGRGPAARL